MTDGIDLIAILTIVLALGVGGFVKGATGSGAPLVAVPIIATFYDITMAILVMVVPNIVMNAKQVLTFRASIRPAEVAIMMSAGAIPGIVVGTLLLTSAPQDILLVGLGLILVAFLTLRVVDPQFSISERVARIASLPTGFAGGILQGVVGTSGPLVLLFLSSQKLTRPVFIGTISTYFLVNSAFQALALMWEGLLTLEWIGISALALIPVWLCLPLGGKVAQMLSTESFNRWVMALLAILAFRLIARGLADNWSPV